MSEPLQFHGKVVVRGVIEVLTGLAIGGQQSGLEIGGVDNPVIKDAHGRPFIPGSSLKGKLRSLSERLEGLVPNTRLGDVRIHTCQDDTSYKDCLTCHIFGLPGEQEFGGPTRITMRDASLREESIDNEMREFMDLPYTEVKMENALDRITSAAMPRQFERVPAGAEFDFEMVFTLYEQDDIQYLRRLIQLMRLLEDDALGGSGSRGYGRVAFSALDMTWKSRACYMGETEPDSLLDRPADLEFLQENMDELFEPLQRDLDRSITAKEK